MHPLRPPRVPVAPTYTQLQHLGGSDAPRNSDAWRLRRAAGVLLLIFCLGMAVSLVHIIGISQEVLARLEHQQPSLLRQPHTQSRDVLAGAWQPIRREGEGANVLVAYSDGPHLSKLAAAVEIGTRNILGNETTSLRVRTLDNVSFMEDVMWADAVILGSHVVNANVEPKMAKFLSDWSFSEDLSQKVGAVFVTSGGLSAGEELTMVNLLHSLMIFRMIIVGGERWTSAFGASAIIGEGPFEPAGTHNSPEQRDFPPICYPTDSDAIHDMFKDKAIGLGERVASIATQLRRARADLSRQN
ncbi:hypothetical protein KRP22_008317 [Phytophthora ramorum]|uniref:uncharacterized protein n=1 Tax=Phytophthora ramorum TaxID=164328 RepID=UPI00309AB9A0|nr:hypothetical protein KRP23_5602 [Phytophthora ramorum]KAH7505698.1 hypothetical protein KRP22_3671 [Phytophthora ramorum]